MPTFLGYNQRHKNEYATIYSISDPDSSDVFYVGKTEKQLGQRLNSHICRARKHPNAPLSRRLLEIITRGKRPHIEAIEVIHIDKWQDAEMFWISQFKSSGCILLNIHRGGRGW